MKPDQDLIDICYANLPERMAEYINSGIPSQKNYLIFNARHLHIDQMEIADEIVTEVLIGASRTSDFLPRLKSEVELTQEQAELLAQDVNEQIFKPVQDSLRAMQEEAEKGQIEEKHLTREELLHQLENPVPIPMSGRRAGVDRSEQRVVSSGQDADGPRFIVGKSGIITDTETDSLGGSTSKSGEEVEPRTEDAEEEGRPVPIITPSRPRTILERKLAEPTVVEKNSAPIDPYREPTV